MPSALCPYRPADVHFLTRFEQSPILRKNRFDRLSADPAFTSPKLFLMTVKFLIGHNTTATQTFRKQQIIH
jgi:hypothetical protein